MGATANRGGQRVSASQGAPPTPPRAADDRQTERDSSSDTAMRRPRRSAERRLSHKGACEKGEQFMVASRSFPLSEGCYSQGAQYNGEAIYSPPSGDNAPGNYLVGATQGEGNDPYDVRCNTYIQKQQ